MSKVTRFFSFLLLLFSIHLQGMIVDEYFNSGSTVVAAHAGAAVNITNIAIVDVYDNVLTSSYDIGEKKSYITRMNEKGVIDTSFSSDGVHVFSHPSSGSSTNFKITTSPVDGAVYYSYLHYADLVYSVEIIKIDPSTGELDSSFGTSGVLSVSQDFNLNLVDTMLILDYEVLVDFLGRVLLLTVCRNKVAVLAEYKYVTAWQYSDAGTQLVAGTSAYMSLMDVPSAFDSWTPQNNYLYHENVAPDFFIDSAGAIYLSCCFLHYPGANYKLCTVKMHLDSTAQSLTLDSDFSTVKKNIQGEFGDDVAFLTRSDIQTRILPHSTSTKSNLAVATYPKGYPELFLYEFDASTGGVNNNFGSQGKVQYDLEGSDFDYTFDSVKLYDASRSSSGEIYLGAITFNSGNSVSKFSLLKLDKGWISKSDYLTFHVISGGDAQEPSLAIDSGDALVFNGVEQVASYYYMGTKRYLVADDINSLLSAGDVSHIDAFTAINYTEDTVASLRDYHQIDYWKDYLSGIWNIFGADESDTTTAASYFSSAYDAAFGYAIERAAANSFSGSMLMKYKRGVAKREMYKLISASTFSSVSSSIYDAILKLYLELVMENIAVQFDDIRSSVIS